MSPRNTSGCERTIRLALLLPVVLALAGCTSGPSGGSESRYAAFYGVEVANATGCSLTLPYPFLGAEAWATPNADGTTQASAATTAYGPGLRLSGLGRLAVEASSIGPAPSAARLSLQQGEWTPQASGEVATYWVEAAGCEGARLNLVWVVDGEPFGTRVAIVSDLADGWREVPAGRDPV